MVLFLASMIPFRKMLYYEKIDPDILKKDKIYVTQENKSLQLAGKI